MTRIALVFSLLVPTAMAAEVADVGDLLDDTISYASSPSTPSSRPATVAAPVVPTASLGTVAVKAKPKPAVVTKGRDCGRGIASIYTDYRVAQPGSHYSANAMAAANKTLPFGTKVLVTNLKTGKTVTVTINDRGPYVRGRVIDLTPAAAKIIGFSTHDAGLANVKLTCLSK